MIDCAIVLGGPRKRELALRSPLLVAAGALGAAPSPRDHPFLAPDGPIGGVVTPPFTVTAITETGPARLARTTAGYVLHGGRRNPGLRRAIRRYNARWERMGLPVIAALYARYPADVAELAAAVSECECLQGIEIHFPSGVAPDEAFESTRLALGESAVPCLARVPFGTAVEVARAVADAEVDALVVAAPPVGRAPGEAGRWVSGPFHSPALTPLYVELVQRVRAATPIPIIARGGIADTAHALALFGAGAIAVQLDSILMVRPAAPDEIYRDLEAELARLGAKDWDSFLRAIGTHPSD